jgi:nitric oxide reductase large subunit
MADRLSEPLETLSSWWRVAALATMAAGFAVLILLTMKAYQNAPPIPDKFVERAGAVVFTADDVLAGQQVFLKHGLMDNGTIWGTAAISAPIFRHSPCTSWPSTSLIVSRASVSVAVTLTLHSRRRPQSTVPLPST